MELCQLKPHEKVYVWEPEFQYWDHETTSSDISIVMNGLCTVRYLVVLAKGREVAPTIGEKYCKLAELGAGVGFTDDNEDDAIAAHLEGET